MPDDRYPLANLHLRTALDAVLQWLTTNVRLPVRHVDYLSGDCAELTLDSDRPESLLALVEAAEGLSHSVIVVTATPRPVAACFLSLSGQLSGPPAPPFNVRLRLTVRDRPSLELLSSCALSDDPGQNHRVITASQLRELVSTGTRP